MRECTSWALVFMSLCFIPGPAAASEQAKTAAKLESELGKISLIATDLDGRRVVNRVMARQLGLSRQQLVEDRRQTGFVYGELFAAHRIARLAALSFDEVAVQMRMGQSLLEICVEYEVSVSKLLKDARKLNKAIEAELDRVARGEEPEGTSVEASEPYDPAFDTLAVDTAGFSAADLRLASERVHRRVQPGVAVSPVGRGASIEAGRGAASRRTVGAGGGRGPR